jgi:hypothetical protein
MSPTEKIVKHDLTVYLLAIGGLSLTLGVHLAAWTHMELAHRQFVIMDDAVERKMALVDFLHGHAWLAVFYAALVLGSLIWLQCRREPWLLRYLTLAIYLFPCWLYLWPCLYLAGKFINW